jgi:hypothetical protein
MELAPQRGTTSRLLIPEGLKISKGGVSQVDPSPMRVEKISHGDSARVLKPRSARRIGASKLGIQISQPTASGVVEDTLTSGIPIGNGNGFGMGAGSQSREKGLRE